MRLIPVEGGTQSALMCSEQPWRNCVSPAPSSQTGDAEAVGNEVGRMKGAAGSCVCRVRGWEGALPCIGLSCFPLHC